MNKIKDKNYMIISIDTENSFEKIQHLFVRKNSQQSCIEGIYLNIIRAMYDRLRANLYPMMKS